MKISSVLHISASSDFGGGPIFISNISEYSSIKSFYYGPDGKILDRIKLHCELITTKFTFLFNLYLIKSIFFLNIKNIHMHGRGALIYNIINIFVLRFFSNKKSFMIIFTPHGISSKFSIIDFACNLLCIILVDIITFVSYDEYYSYSSKYKIRNKYIIIKNGVKVNDKLILNHQYKNKKIISFSRFTDQKNTIELCKIAAKLPDFNFAVFGNGPDKIICINYCINHNISNVTFNNFTNHPVDAILSGFCYLSTSSWEGLPLAVLEAISLQRSICITNVSGHAEFKDLDFNNIKYYNLGDIDTAASCIRSLYFDIKNNYTEYHINKFKSIYDIKNTVMKYESLYI